MGLSGTALATGVGAGVWALFTDEETKNKGKYITINNEQYINPYWSANGPGGLRQVGIPDYSKNSELIQVLPPDKDGNILEENVLEIILLQNFLIHLEVLLETYQKVDFLLMVH